MITDFETNTVYFSKLLKTDNRFLKTFNEITERLSSVGIPVKLLEKTRDIWARDYMPIQVTKEKFIEYRYDPDYLQKAEKGYRNLKSYPDIICDKLEPKIKTVKTDIILDGGNVIKSNDCVILTDKIVKENRCFYNKKELVKELERLFEVNKIILIPWDKLNEYGHADGMLRFIDNETVLINEIYEEDSILTYRLEESGIKREYLKFNVKKRNVNNWGYINFLQTSEVIIVPEFDNEEEDEQALKQLKEYYPDYAKRNRIFQIDMNDVVIYGGALNCISWTVKE